MKKVLLATSALCVAGGMASAAGLDRSTPYYSAMFQQGNYLQFGFAATNPNVEGTHPSASATALSVSEDSGNMANNESFLNLALKLQVNEKLSFNFFVTNPYGASADYKAGIYSAAPAFSSVGTGPSTVVLSGATNLKADWESTSYQAVLKYNVTDQASVYGGLRAVTSSAEIALPAQLVAVASGNTLAGDYFANASTETDLGFVLGAAYEIPDIAARIAVTYLSEIEHEFSVNETASRTQTPVATGVSSVLTLLSQETKTKITIPQSVIIDFQTGIAEDTLLFGSARWTEWSKWQVGTDGYTAATGGNITGFENDTWAYSLGVGRRLNDNFSVFSSIGYEEAKGGDLNRLAPTDGSRSFALGGQYTFSDGTTVRAGMQRSWLGGGETSDGSEFEGATVDTFGMSMGFSF